MIGVNIFLAEGFEELEAVATRDVLSRGGVDVKLVSITEDPFVVSARGLMMGVDAILEDLVRFGDSDDKITRYDVMIFPGGLPGAENLAADKQLISLMNDHYSLGGTVAAICASPKFVLSKLDGISQAEFTCYDGCEDTLEVMGAKFLPRPAVTSGRIITGRGPGHAVDFGLEILRYLKGDEVASSVSDDMILECTGPF